MNDRAIHLGDGDYATIQEDGCLMLTSGSHLRNEASSAMWLEPTAIELLLEFLKNPELGDAIDDTD